MPGLLQPNDPQQQLMLSLMQGNGQGGWSAAQQNAVPGTMNPMSGLPTAAGVAQQAAASAAQPRWGSSPWQIGAEPGKPMGPLSAAQEVGNRLQQNVYGGGQPLTEKNAGLLGAAGFPSFQDPRLVADRLAQSTQDPNADPDELARRRQAFMNYIGGGGGGGGYGSDTGREGEGGGAGGGGGGSGGQGQDASGQW